MSLVICSVWRAIAKLDALQDEEVLRSNLKYVHPPWATKGGSIPPTNTYCWATSSLLYSEFLLGIKLQVSKFSTGDILVLLYEIYLNSNYIPR